MPADGPSDVSVLAGQIMSLSKIKKGPAMLPIDRSRADTVIEHDQNIKRMVDARKNFPAISGGTVTSMGAPTQIGPMFDENEFTRNKNRVESFEDETIPGNCTKQSPYKQITPDALGGQRRPTIKAE